MPESPELTPQEIADDVLDGSTSRREAFEPKGLFKKVDGEMGASAYAQDYAEADLTNSLVDAALEEQQKSQKLAEVRAMLAEVPGQEVAVEGKKRVEDESGINPT